MVQLNDQSVGVRQPPNKLAVAQPLAAVVVSVPVWLVRSDAYADRYLDGFEQATARYSPMFLSGLVKKLPPSPH